MISNRENMITKKRDLLLCIISNPSKFEDNDYLNISLKSQGGLALFEDKALGIEKCSLNTFKAASREYLNGGFKEINELRLNAKSKLNAPQEEVSENTKTISGAKRKSERLQRELSMVREQNFLFSIIIMEMKSKMKELAESSTSVSKRKAIYQLYEESLEHKLSYSLRNEDPNNEL